jgi:hypothetical protein
MAASQWWVIVGTSYGSAPSYSYFSGTQAQAQARAKSTVEVSTQQNLYGPYATRADAQAAVSSKKLAAPTPGGGASIPGLSALTSWEQGATTLLGDLTSKGTWLRVAKVVVGSTMIIVGLVKLTGAGKAAATAAKGALP